MSSGTSISSSSVARLVRPVGTSFILHSGLSVGTWAIGVATGRMDVKDCLWPSGMVINAWYQAVGIPVFRFGLPVSVVLKEMPWRGKLLLTGSSLWGLRLFAHMVARAYARGGDDPRYTADAAPKVQQSFFKSLFTKFLPEVAFQSLITIPFTAPFRNGFAHYGQDITRWGWTDALAIGLWTVGMAMEVLADRQLEEAKVKGETKTGVCKEGVWSIVRHPNYLGDFLTHLSFPLLLLNGPAFHPFFFLGPLTDYIFLRYMDGDRLTETYQEEHYSYEKRVDFHAYRQEKNAFWPSVKEVKNKWTWVLVACGAAGIVIEEVVRQIIDPLVL